MKDEKQVSMNSLQLFNRLIIINERELTITKSLESEVTPRPIALYTENQFMRKTEKAALGNYLKKKAAPLSASNLNINTTIVVGYCIRCSGRKIKHMHSFSITTFGS